MLAVVTGPCGHLGANLVRALINKGWNVRALVHRDVRALEGLKVERVSGDVLDINSLKRAFHGVDIVFHLAARISIVSWDRRQVEALNIGGVKNVVAACLTCGVKRLVHASSIHAHQPRPLNEVLDETRPILDGARYPPYDYSKAEGERIVRQGIADGLDAVIVNPTAIIGPNDFAPSHFGSVVLNIARTRLPALVDAGFDWVDARDVAGGMLSAAERARPGEKYLLSGHWVKVKDIARQVCQCCGSGLPAVTLPVAVARLGAPFIMTFDRVAGRRPFYTSIAMRALENSPRVSHAKASRNLGYQPRPIETTIADTIEWFRNNGYLQRK